MYGYALASFLSFCAGAAFAAAMLRPRPSRRGGYVMPPASSGTNRPAGGTYGIHRTRVGFSSYDPPGTASVAEGMPPRQALRNSFTAPTLFGCGTEVLGESGRTRRAPADYGEAA